MDNCSRKIGTTKGNISVVDVGGRLEKERSGFVLVTRL